MAKDCLEHWGLSPSLFASTADVARVARGKVLVVSRVKQVQEFSSLRSRSHPMVLHVLADDLSDCVRNQFQPIQKNFRELSEKLTWAVNEIWKRKLCLLTLLEAFGDHQRKSDEFQGA